MSETVELARAVLSKITSTGDGEYTHRMSGVSRCARDAVLQAQGHKWSNPPRPEWGDQVTFDMGHSGEARVIRYLEKAGIQVVAQQLSVLASSPMGERITGHIDGILLIPEGLPMGGKRYLMDVKTTSNYGYAMVVKDGEPKRAHKEQLTGYKYSVVDDDDYPLQRGVMVKDLDYPGYEWGGMIVIYHPKERPTRGFGNKKEELDRLAFIHFDAEEDVHEASTDLFDLIQHHITNETLPPIPDPSDEMVWGGWDKTKKRHVARRCSPRWCRRYDICRELA